MLQYAKAPISMTSEDFAKITFSDLSCSKGCQRSTTANGSGVPGIQIQVSPGKTAMASNARFTSRYGGAATSNMSSAITTKPTSRLAAKLNIKNSVG